MANKNSFDLMASLDTSQLEHGFLGSIRYTLQMIFIVPRVRMYTHIIFIISRDNEYHFRLHTGPLDYEYHFLCIPDTPLEAMLTYMSRMHVIHLKCTITRCINRYKD